MNLEDHPTVRLLSEHAAGRTNQRPTDVVLEGAWLRHLALDLGADDAGLVEIGRPGLDPQREEILRNYPWTKSLLSIVLRMAREPVRGAPRSVANLEFHRAGHEVNEICAAIVAKLESQGIRAVNPSMGFPMEMYQNPRGAIWVVSHKPVAVEAGLGHMGIHRNLIHPKFGNFVLLGTVLIGCEASDYDHPLDYNPCLECKLCVAACPVGAIGPDGTFNFSSCFTHNYREFLGGFSDWVEQVADARNAIDYRRRVSEPETASMWQSLTYGANYKSAYCVAVCPAGEDVTHNMRTFRFRPPNGGQIPFTYLPGQFLTLHIAPQGIPTKRSYTIASTPTWHDRIEITIKREEHGLVSRWLHDELQIGDEVQIEAPNGTFCFTGKQSESVVLIAGGVGITPMMSAARYLTETSWPGKVYLVLGFQHRAISFSGKRSPSWNPATPISASRSQ